MKFKPRRIAETGAFKRLGSKRGSAVVQRPPDFQSEVPQPTAPDRAKAKPHRLPMNRRRCPTASSQSRDRDSLQALASKPESGSDPLSEASVASSVMACLHRKQCRKDCQRAEWILLHP